MSKRRHKTPPAVQVRIVPHPRKITPALPAAVPRVRAKKGKR
ncbi:hypothetical protein [Mycobacterium sp.]